MKITAIVITKNEQEMISECLNSLSFASEVIVVDTGNSDKTNEIALQKGAKIVKSDGKNYSEFRNTGIHAATGEWILFVDADERVSAELASELKNIQPKLSTYLIPRKNNYLGKFMKHGGWGNEKLPRLFKKSNLKGYKGELHEQPEFTGELGVLNGSLLHYSHRDIFSMALKTNVFTEFESRLRQEAHHPEVVTWRIFRVMLTEYYNRFIKLSAWKDGPEGVIDGMFQVFNTFIIYSKLWEMQQRKK